MAIMPNNGGTMGLIEAMRKVIPEPAATTAPAPAPVTEPAPAPTKRLVRPKQSDLEQEIARLKAENEALKNAKLKAVKNTLKVSQKGAISLYGMGKFPITLYANQWDKLIEFVKTGAIEEFAVKNASSLKVKE